MNPNTNHQQYWNDEPNWEHLSEAGNPTRAKICLQRMEERNAEFNEPDTILQDAMDNWEYDNQFHTCYLCKNTGHEEGMHKNNLGYFVHDECELQMEETLKHIHYEK